jgi:protein-S-isoprenylcysteine O-methyltransferase Ste14
MKPSLQKNQVRKLSFIFLLSNFTLFIFWILFAVRHIKAYLLYPQNYILIFIISEAIIALLFLFRKKEISISRKKFDWLISITATFLPLLLIPGGKVTNLNLGINLMTTGVIIQMAAALSLNRSLGIVPANRDIKTNGLYKLIRHPMYLSYFLTYIGYGLVSFSLFNFCLITFTLVSVLIRIKIEETFLNNSTEYEKYKKR